MEKTLEPLDLLWGPRPIAAVANLTVRQVQNMLTRGTIPARKIGGRYCISEKALRDFLLGDRQAKQAA